MTPSGSLRSKASRAVETALSSPQSQHVRRCVPRGLTARLASPLPTHLLRICAGALYRRAQCAVSKFAGGKEPTGLFARMRLLTPTGGAKEVDVSLAFKNNFCKEGSPPLRRSGANYASRCVPRGFAPMLAAPLPVKLAARFLREPFLKHTSASKPRFCAAGLNLRHTWRLLYNKNKTAGGR